MWTLFRHRKPIDTSRLEKAEREAEERHRRVCEQAPETKKLTEELRQYRHTDAFTAAFKRSMGRD
jgi:hypothetical protein